MRISATSITVTATASTSDPKGSPTRWATTSAWCTADSTAAARTRATSVTGSGPSARPHVRTSATTATTGTTVDQAGTNGRLVATMAPTLPDSPVRPASAHGTHGPGRAADSKEVSGGRSGPPGRCGTCPRGRVGAEAPRSRRTGGRAGATSCAGTVDTLAQCGRAAYGASAASTAGRTAATAVASGPGEVERDAVALVGRADPEVVGSDGADLAALHHRRDQGGQRAQGTPGVAGGSRGTKYSDCSSSPLLGVNSTRKCASRSCHGPATPSCSVQFTGGMPGVMWRGPSASRPPIQRARGPGGGRSSARCFSHAW